MPLIVNLRHLEEHNVRLEGSLPIEELEIDTRDEMIRVAQPLEYALEVQKLEGGLLIQGRLGMELDCQCVRCLKPFRHQLELKDWTTHIPLQGEERAPVVNDCVDLTPVVREDILLELPRHPLCDAGCGGLPEKSLGKAEKTKNSAKTAEDSSAWAELNKLKF